MMLIVSGVIINIFYNDYQPIRTAGAGPKETPLMGQALTLYLLNCSERSRAAEALGWVGGGVTAIIYQSAESVNLLINNITLNVPT